MDYFVKNDLNMILDNRWTSQGNGTISGKRGNKIEVYQEADFTFIENGSGVQSDYKIIEGIATLKTQEERDAEKAIAEIEAQKQLDDRRTEACLTYQSSRSGGRCDANFIALLTSITAISKMTNVPPKTKALACINWLQNLWDDESSRIDDNIDFSSHGKIPYNYKAVQDEAHE